MQVTRIYCGLDTNGHDVDANRVALDLAAKYFPNGHTINFAQGRWSGEVGVINEPTIVVEVLCSSNEIERDQHHHSVQLFAGAYKDLAYQESVMVTSQEIDAWFV